MYLLSSAASILILYAVRQCFKFRHLTKPIPNLYNIINLINVLYIGYFIYLLLLLVRHEDIESNPRPKIKQVNSISCCHWNVNSLLAQNLSKISKTDVMIRSIVILKGIHLEALTSLDNFHLLTSEPTHLHLPISHIYFILIYVLIWFSLINQM